MIETIEKSKTKIAFNISNPALFEARHFVFQAKKNHSCSGVRLSSEKLDYIANLKSKICGSEHYPSTFATKSEMGTEEIPIINYTKIKNIG